MVKQLKTLNVAQEGYESPTCKVYSITVESVIAQSGGKYSSNGTENMTTDSEEDF